ncbi:MAG: hypothetical protein DSY37_04830 [Hyperthermus sp.]|nr:MAG: hypothetical protein DSY37_04830 [Hyperthermus sp.]
MAGHGRPHGSRARIVDVSEHAPGVYKVRISFDNGKEVEIIAKIEGDTLITPFGAYHVPSLASRIFMESSERAAYKPEAWLVRIEGEHIVANLPVRVIEVLTKPGEKVSRGQVVLLVETMKIVSEIRSPCNGIVKHVAAEGSTLDKDSRIATIECL